MSLYGALNIGVAGLTANSAALSVTSSNIANVNTVGYKDATANFSTFLNAEIGVRQQSLGRRHRHGRPGRHQPGPAHHDLVAHRPCRSRATASSWSRRTPAARRPRNIPAPAASRRMRTATWSTPPGFICWATSWIPPATCPTNTTDLSLINVSSLSGKAAASDTMIAAGQSAGQLDGRCRLCRGRHGVPARSTPDFPRTINVYDSQGGTQPITFSFVKTGANTWAYEATYAGHCRQPRPARQPDLRPAR